VCVCSCVCVCVCVLQVKPMHDQFVEPSKQYADLIVPFGHRNVAAIQVKPKA